MVARFVSTHLNLESIPCKMNKIVCTSRFNLRTCNCWFSRKNVQVWSYVLLYWPNFFTIFYGDFYKWYWDNHQQKINFCSRKYPKCKLHWKKKKIKLHTMYSSLFKISILFKAIECILTLKFLKTKHWRALKAENLWILSSDSTQNRWKS